MSNFSKKLDKAFEKTSKVQINKCYFVLLKEMYFNPSNIQYHVYGCVLDSNSIIYVCGETFVYNCNFFSFSKENQEKAISDNSVLKCYSYEQAEDIVNNKEKYIMFI
jgi:hypothetical protein